MFANLVRGLGIHTNALVLRAERQRIIASNIANADTPGFVGRDVNFKEALMHLTQSSGSEMMGQNDMALRVQLNTQTATTNPRHFAVPGASDSQLTDASSLVYTLQSQPSADGNSVDMDRERATFVDNSVRYEATLRFINGQSKTILSAIQGQ